jgi:hypothetical protein
MRLFFSLLLITVSLVSLLSCNNPFSTRTPETPPPGGAAILPPTSPEKVLNNLVESMRTKSSQDYMDIFSDTFVFSPDPLDSLEYEQDFRNGWNRENESVFTMNFFVPDSTFTISLDTYSTPVYNPGDQMYRYYYKLTFGREGAEEVTRGEAWLYFRENSEGRWSIYLWVDHRVQQGTGTWGSVRARYS